MSSYLRDCIPDNIFTINLQDRKSQRLVIHTNERQANATKQAFHIDAWVVLPDHLYVLNVPSIGLKKIYPLDWVGGGVNTLSVGERNDCN